MRLLITNLMKGGGRISSSLFGNSCNNRVKNTTLDQDVIRKVGGGGGSPFMSGKHNPLGRSKETRELHSKCCGKQPV